MPGQQAFVKSAIVCPCGSGLNYEQCCGRYHTQNGLPADAQALTRARYCAYVIGLEAYIRATWHPATCPDYLAMDEAPRPQWLGLAIRSFTVLDDSHASVEFIARYKINGRAFRLHETSHFERIDGQWYYVEGEQKA